MIKFIISIILTAGLSFASALFLPWWSIAVVAFIVAVAIPQKPLFAFFSAATALFLLWGLQAFIIDKNNNHLLASRIADLLIHRRSYLSIIIITATVGAIVSGFAALSGSSLRGGLQRERSINRN
jgi:cbb3-type cytochrome oxidase subunit 1